MKTTTLICSMSFMSIIFSAQTFAAKTIWEGKVQSDGTPTKPIPLTLRKEYQIKVSGFMNLGKWIQNREKLANDACYEFSSEKEVAKIDTLKNSQDISACDGTYHQDHVYTSAKFTAKQNRIHFWTYDTDYDDNSGSFHVEVIQLDN